MSTWRPIEEAPKDRKVIVANESGAWIARWFPVYVSGFRPENPWQSMMLNHDGIGHGIPTVFMLLPDPPEGELT